ncbi:MAG: transcription antitermination factor NusB [Turicibacter sp.]
MIRHVIRQLAVQTLYQMEVGQMTRTEAIENIEAMVESLKEEALEIVADEVMPSNVHTFNKHFNLDSYYFELVDGVLTHQSELDSIIETSLYDWSISRLNKVDKAILRLATFEMKYTETTAKKIVIDEALELTKDFSDTGDGKARSFNNKVLDQISKTLA